MGNSPARRTTPRGPTPHRRAPSAAALAMAVALAAAPGCARYIPGPDGTVSLDDFQTDPAAPVAQAGRLDPAAGGRLSPAHGFDASLDPRGVMDVVAVPGDPQRGPGESETVHKPVTLDAKVGEINGDPVFASRFFDELFATRLRADSRVKPRTQWLADTETEIRRKIDNRLAEVLLVEEGRASLNPEQQMGLRQFLQRAQRDLQSRNMGSFVQASQRLEGEDSSIEQFVREQEEEILFGEALRPLDVRVQVTPTDIRRYYERNYGQYNHGTAHLRVIRLPADQTDPIQRVNTALQEGRPFEEVASWEVNRIAPDRGGAIDPFQYEGDYTSSSPFGAAEMNEAARGLERGRWAGPVPWGRGMVGWVYLEQLDHRATSLYDAQLEIERKLRQERQTQERLRFLTYLMERASFTDPDEMVAKLLEIADERFYEGPPAG